MIASYKICDLEVGLEETILKEVKIADIENFCKLTGDYHPLHIDADFAKNNGYKDILAHGLFVSSLSSTLIGMKLPGRNALVMGQDFKYKHPVYPGDKLSIKGVVSSIDERFSIITVKVKIINQIDKVVALGNYQVKLRT